MKAWEESNMELLQAAINGDRNAREQMVTANMGLVWSIVRRFGGRGCEPEDLAQIGCIGLLKAIDKFDPAFEVKFSTYAVPIISGEIKRFLRDDGMIKVSRTLKEMAMKARFIMEELGTELGREPTVSQIAARMGVEAEELAVALESGAEVESIYKTVYQSDGADICLIDRLEEKENFQDSLLNEMVLAKALGELTAQERRLIQLRYYRDMTQSKVAGEMGISQVQVSRWEKKILKRLREMFAE